MTTLHEALRDVGRRSLPAPSPTEPPEFYLGLDLGQAQDFTALAVLERRAANEEEEATYFIRHLQRWPLGTGYPAIVEGLVGLLNRETSPGTWPLHGCTLGVDETGVGRPVVDLLRKARPPARLVPVMITAGAAVTPSPGGGWHVPKRQLVSILQVLLGSHRLKWDRSLPEGRVLASEFSNFTARITTAGNEVFEADWRSRAHDDLVLAVSIAAWLAERARRRLAIFVATGGPWR